MKTTIDIPRDLLDAVKSASHSDTNREAVIRALEEYLRMRRSAELVTLLGTFSEFTTPDELEANRSES